MPRKKKAVTATEDETPAQSEPTVVTVETQPEPKKLCACAKNCGREAPSFGPYNPECYAEYQLERGKVECSNFERCHNFTKPFIKDGQPIPSFCLECRQAHQANVTESTESAKSFCYSILETLERRFSDVDFEPAFSLRDDADVKFATDAMKEAAALYQAALNKANSLVAHYVAGLIPEKVSAIMGVIDPHLERKGGDLVFRDLITDLDRLGDEVDIAHILKEDPPKEASLDMQARIQALDLLLNKAEARAERFAPPDPRRSEQLRKQQREQQRQRADDNIERIHRASGRRRHDED